MLSNVHIYYQKNSCVLPTQFISNCAVTPNGTWICFGTADGCELLRLIKKINYFIFCLKKAVVLLIYINPYFK